MSQEPTLNPLCLGTAFRSGRQHRSNLEICAIKFRLAEAKETEAIARLEQAKLDLADSELALKEAEREAQEAEREADEAACDLQDAAREY
jgi:hypothetical protein